MADTPNLDIDDQASLEAELARLKAGQQQPPVPPADADTGIPPAEVAPAEPVPYDAAPPVEAKPDDEARRKAEDAWAQMRRELRESRKRNDDMERQLREVREAQNKPQPVEQPKEPTIEENPVDYFQRRDMQREQEIVALRQRMEQRDSYFQDQQQETQFIQQHPDYMDARNFLEKHVEQEWEESGKATLHVNNLREMVRRGRAGDAQYKVTAEHVDRVAGLREIQNLADKENRGPDDVAMWKVARDTYIGQQHAEERAAAIAAGRTVADNLYRRAQRAGYKAPAANGNSAETGEQARQRVLQSQKVAEAANSLSESGSTGDVEGKRLIKSRQDVMNMDDAELDALIASGKWREL